MQRNLAALLGLALLAATTAAEAHSFGKLYNLPVPFWMYLYGAAAALLLSFLVVGYFINEDAAAANFRSRDISRNGLIRALGDPRTVATFRVLSMMVFLLTVVSGFIGSRNPYLNFNMTWFWIVFVLLFTYVTALTADLYRVLNPWRIGVDWVGRRWPRLIEGRFTYPAALGFYPALVLYMAFIGIELFAHAGPRALSIMLTAYTFINVIGVWLWGTRDWFRYCEFFSVFYDLIARIAPIGREPLGEGSGAGHRIVLRQPFIGLIREDARHFSLLLFVLFMLSSTAYDGLRDTLPWVKIFWKDLYQGVLKAWLGGDIVKSYPTLQAIYKVWQLSALALSPFFYLALYWISLWFTKLLTRTEIPLRELALKFALSLIPIAFVYNITHYYTLIITQGSQMVRMISDPFGRGWNLFGTAQWMRASITPDASFVWNSQVILILMGHIISVYLSHLVALRVFPTQRQATLSQIPMLLLMVAYTTIGLWILSQPITSGQVFVPTPTK